MNGRSATAFLLALLSAACSKGSNAARPAPSASASAAASSSPTVASDAAPTPALPLTPPSATPACRALRVTGNASWRESGRPLASGALVDGSDWVTLADKAKLTLKHSTSGRELSITGPALFRACARGREQLLLARGSLLSAAGMGARPGAEVLIATPLLLAHYGDAEVQIQLDSKELRLEARAGRVELEVVPAKKKPPPNPLPPRAPLRIPLGKPNARALVDGCTEAAAAAYAAAARVTDSQAKQSLGERARAHVQARQSARASCLVAGAAIGLVADAAERAGLWAEVVRGEGVLESIPPRRAAQAPEK